VVKLIYHNADFDGLCSAAIVLRHFDDRKVEMIGINYGDDFPWNEIDKGETVYMVDFSLEPFEKMRDLAFRCDLWWIDHHKSVIEEEKKSGLLFLGVRRDGTAACTLCWESFHGKGHLPAAVELLSRYDVWDKDKEGIVDAFQLGMKTYRRSQVMPDSSLWDDLFEDKDGIVQKIIAKGTVISEYHRGICERYAKGYSFEKEMFGLRAICCNVATFNSNFFDSVYDPEKHDIMIMFCTTKKESCVVSLYSTKPEVDCGKIAKTMGGGGHAGAAGFHIESAEKLFRLNPLIKP